MPCDLASKPAPELGGNRWLMAALTVLWLYSGYLAVTRLWDHAPFRLALFLVGAIAYFFMMSDRAERLYRARGYRGYFLHQMLALTVTIYAARSDVMFAWTLCLPVIAQAVIYLPPRKMAATLAVVLVIGATPAISMHAPNRTYFAINYAITILFTAGCAYAIRREFIARRQLHEAHEQLRTHSRNAEALAAAEERNRLAREIHDGVAHHLTSAHVLVEAGLALLPPATPATATNSLQKAQQQIRAALGELRDSIANRRPAHDTPISDRLNQLIQDGNFPATLALSGPPRRFASTHEQALYRVAQEALTNARKHAPDHTICMSLDFSEPSSIRLRIENDQPAQTASGDGAFGLLSLRERMQQLGGTFSAGGNDTGQFVVLAELSA
jgi:signal transduction histidine kinase